MVLPLANRTALITGVSRRRGIGFAVAKRLASMGASLVLHQHPAHDQAEYGQTDDLQAMRSELRELLVDEAAMLEASGDLAEAEIAESLVPSTNDAIGHLDILVCNHAHGGDAVSLGDVTTSALDRHWAVNTRATLLLTSAFAQQHDGRDGGRVVWMTSGQALGPMAGNLAYAASKAALAGTTGTVADELIGKGIRMNTVNPGPVNTGYLDGAPSEFRERFPLGRIGEPDDAARLVAFLVSDEGRWIVGQVLNSEGGFRR